jgi:hypothetical protein
MSQYLSLEEAARLLGLTKSQLNNLRERGVMRAVADRGNWVFALEELQRVDPDVDSSLNAKMQNVLTNRDDLDGRSLDEYDGRGCCTRCGYLFVMRFDDAICPRCGYKMSPEQAFRSCAGEANDSLAIETTDDSGIIMVSEEVRRPSDRRGVANSRVEKAKTDRSNHSQTSSNPSPPSASRTAISQVRNAYADHPSNWFYKQHGTRFGPYSAAHIGALLSNKQVRTNDLLWHESLNEWVPAIRVSLFHEVLRTVVKQTGPVICGKCANRFDSLFVLKQHCVGCADEDGANWHSEFNTWLGELERSRCFTKGWLLSRSRPKCPSCGTTRFESLSLVLKQHLGTGRFTHVEYETVKIEGGDSVTIPYSFPGTIQSNKVFLVCTSCRAAWAYVESIRNFD